MRSQRTASSSGDVRAEEQSPVERQEPRRPRGSPAGTLGVFGLYLATSVVLFGLPILSDPRHTFIGPPASPDPRFFVWALAWWPHALIHGLNPIWTNMVWAPPGYNLAWATGAPGPCLLMLPITLAAGPVMSYNLLALLACPLAAITAFILCRHVTGRFWPSVLGGYVFGFSTYQLGHLGMHINLELVFPVPLAVYLVLRHAEGSIGSRPFVALLTLVLAFEFLTSTEVFATLVVFGALAMALAIVLAPPRRRGPLLSTVGGVALSVLLAGVVVSPFMYYVFAFGVPRRHLSGSDILSFFIPRVRTLIGSRLFIDLTRSFPGSASENTAYLGPPLVAILVHFAVTEWRRRTTKLLIALLALTGLAALGPKLYVSGHPTILLPWRAVEALPIINNVATRRLSMYLFLISAVISALWLSSTPTRARWGVALLTPVFLFPIFSPKYVHASADIPRFFASGNFRRFVSPGQNLLILPSEAPSGYPQSISMLIQARTGFSFRMVLAYTGPPPPEFRASPILQALYKGSIPAVGAGEFARFLGVHRVRAIILDRGSTMEAGLSSLMNAPPRKVDDVLIYVVQPP
jgi:hypothetical protein